MSRPTKQKIFSALGCTSLHKESSLVAWLQLLRLPNVFTALADVMMGYLVAYRGQLQSIENFGFLAVASTLLYLSGMVLNDVFDAEADTSDRPDRPIPSSRVSVKAASALGWGMLTGGLAIAWYLSFSVNDWRPGVVATLLAACILLYDGALKRTRLAPLVMGECRTLNVLLGMSLMLIPWGKAEILIAIGIGIYIMGVTIFARTDARISTRTRLTSGFIVLLSGVAIVAAVPWQTVDRPPLAIILPGWYLLWAAVALIIGRRCIMAIFEPSPKRVQTAVRHCVHSIIMLDAAVCVGYASSFWAFAILSLLIPTILLTLWLNAT
jgi:4-hydroxybenzoate polyprenyltransferase